MISAGARTDAGVLENAKDELADLARTAATAIESLAETFRILAGQVDKILGLAAGIVGCVENKGFGSLLPDLEAFSATTGSLIRDRVGATAGILETATAEVTLLRKLLKVTRGQADIAQETKALSILTNVEVAHLGQEGEGFQYLAHELASFAKSVNRGIDELERQTSGRLAVIEQTRSTLAAEQPRLRDEFARMEADLGAAFSAVDRSLSGLSQTPTQFRLGAQDVAGQIAGVVTAIQGHDITRQQIEHVQEALTLIPELSSDEGCGEQEASANLSRAYAGLSIQVYQLQAVKETVASWVGQIWTCMGEILRVSASDLAGIGPEVLQRERELSSRFADIERLECESRSHSRQIQATFGGLATLMELFREHLNKSNSVRDRLRLLTFNSIVEASKVGTRAAAILAIANVIKETSNAWSESTDQSEQTMQQVANLGEQSKALMEAFSSGGKERRRDAQVRSETALDSLRSAVAVAAQQARETLVATESMQAAASDVSQDVGVLEDCGERINAVLGKMEGIRQQWESDQPDVKDQRDAAEIEQLFARSYTTERERAILRAFLEGAAPPAAQQANEGNDVELF